MYKRQWGYLLKRRSFIVKRRVAIPPEYKADYCIYVELLPISVNDVHEIGYTIEYSVSTAVDNIVEREKMKLNVS